ncbi:hypothetical protein SEUBUCD646_0K03170 [Saccharomyces eubayanus]|uniref:Sir1 ORC-binding domain-containing protein n=1 Tax=Saccharomyces eubayanus TaxID=1080349 RepID=A0ABN8VGP0_SACEU|nr:hypothetical protein SEUBUCD650_0K03160 [Saccharomyces eubayanus]CAI1583769.1 hypothetical protein SEUBUCD646_0K03170 [Saccharomyces eubayanus]
MFRVNSKFVVIDGWLVDVVERKPVNFRSPEIRLLIPNDDDYEKLLKQDLVDWTELKKDAQSILVGVDSVELFKHIKLSLQEFFLLDDGKVVLKRIRSKSHYKVIKKFAQRCCRLFLPKWGTIYIYPMIQDDRVRPDGVLQFSLDVQPSLEYPLIDINVNNQYIIIEGFLIYLNERRLCKWNDNNLRDWIGLKTWTYLRRLYNPISLDIVYNLNSNYYFVKDDQFFQIMGKRAFVRFSNVVGNDTRDKVPFYVCVRTTTTKATHIAYIVTDVTQISFNDKKDGLKFIVRERPIMEDVYSDVNISELENQLFIEVKVVENGFSTYIFQLENQLMKFINEEEKTNYRVGMISGEVLDQIRDFPVSKFTMSLIAAGEDRKYIELLQELARRLEKICMEKTLRSLEEIREKFDQKSGMQIGLEMEYYQSTEECKRNLEVIKDDVMLMLVKRLGSRSVHEYGLVREEYISPRFLAADGFLIDLAEEKPINPKDPRLLTLLKDFQRDSIARLSLIDWDDFKKSQGPIPLRARTLFKHCRKLNKIFTQDADFKLNLPPSEVNLTDAQITISYPCIPIFLEDKNVRYLYEDSFIPGSRTATTPSSATFQLNCEWKNRLQNGTELQLQEGVKRMRLLTSYEELRSKYISAFEKLRADDYID